MAKTRIVTPNTGSKRKKSCHTEAVGSSLDRTLTNYVNWDWFVSKLWPDQLWQTTFAGHLAVWRPHSVPTRSPVTTLLLWVHTVEDELQEIVSFSQSAAVWLCQQVQFESKCFPLSNRLSIVLFTDGGSVTSERSTFWGLGSTDYDGALPSLRHRALPGKLPEIRDLSPKKAWLPFHRRKRIVPSKARPKMLAFPSLLKFTVNYFFSYLPGLHIKKIFSFAEYAFHFW